MNIKAAAFTVIEKAINTCITCFQIWFDFYYICAIVALNVKNKKNDLIILLSVSFFQTYRNTLKQTYKWRPDVLQFISLSFFINI